MNSPSHAWRQRQSTQEPDPPERNVSVDRLHHEAENGELLHDYVRSLEYSGHSQNTVRSFRYAIEDFLAFLIGLDLRAVTQREIREWLHWMTAQGRSRHTILQRKYALGSFFNFLICIDIVTSSPVRLINIRNVPRKMPKFLTPEQMDRLLTAADGPRERAVIETLYSTGARVAELAGMCIEDINWSARTILVRGKGDKERFTIMSSKAVDALKLYLKDRTTGPVFLGADQYQWERHTKQQGWVSLDKRYGLWVGYWREDRLLPDGTIRRVARGKTVGRLEDLPTREKASEAMREKLADVLRDLPPRVIRKVKSHRQRPFGQRGIRRMLAEAAVRAGLGRVTPHMIRHTFATALHENGADILSIKELLGHANVSTTQIYTHVSQSQLRATLERCHPRWGGSNE